MVQYNFKSICVVPTAKDFVDIVLSKTQRKTPTVVHKHYKISRIRQFYMRKIRFTQQNFEDMFAKILSEFPNIDDMHPFYSDLINILYDRDHYKIALGQIHKVKQLVSNIGKEYLKLLKFADSLYRCKQLKKAALGRMATLMKRQKEGLEYLESVRQHLSRLPSIDPNQPSILISGFPNVGKSSFINQITRADVEVQPYAFTTKSLYVGHTDHNYLKWQVIDTPGILDKPLEQRNTIEMQAITALAHIKAIVLYFLDVSETCGYSLQEQITLFQNIQPLFVNKPIMIVVNKIDIKPLSELEPEKRELIQQTFNLTPDHFEKIMNNNNNDVDTEFTLEDAMDNDEENESAKSVPIRCISALTKHGVIALKNEACDRLLAYRIEHKTKSGKKMDLIANRLRIAVPKNIIKKAREPFIPAKALQRLELRREANNRVTQMLEENIHDTKIDMDELRSEMMMEAAEAKKLEKDIEQEEGDDYVLDLKKRYDLPNPDHRYDAIPEIWEGKNIADFIDPDIMKRLEELEQDEEFKVSSGFYDDYEDFEDEEKYESIKDLAKRIRNKKMLIMAESRRNKFSNKRRLPRNKVAKNATAAEELQEHMADLGATHLKAIDFKNLNKSNIRKRKRYFTMDEDDAENINDDSMEVDNTNKGNLQLQLRGKKRKHMALMGVQPSKNATGTKKMTLVKKARIDPATGAVSSNIRGPLRRDLQGIRDREMKLQVDRMSQKALIPFNMDGRVGEADRHIHDWKPKHLFSGKRKMGKTQRR